MLKTADMKYYHAVFIIISFLFGCSHAVFADIVINEVAWMGTITSTNDEWIELYNNGTSPVTLDGWTLKATDGSPSISLAGTISAGGFFLLERTDDSTIPNIPAGMIYSGALSNTGEILTLVNNTEQSVDTVSMSSGWTAGNATSKETMQRTLAGIWITAQSTPGAVNATTDTGSDNQSNDNDPINPPPTVPSDDTAEELVIKVEPDPIYSSRMVLPGIVVQQVPVEFSSEVKLNGKYNDLRGRFEWTTGDGASFTFYRSTPFSYTYQEPGEYVVMLRYYSNTFKEKPDTIHQKTITVIPASVEVKDNQGNGSITLINHSKDDIDLGDWTLVRGNAKFIIPKYTILSKDKSITISSSTHKMYTPGKSVLMTPTQHIVNNSLHKNSNTKYVYTPESSVIEIPVDTKELFIEPNDITTIHTPSTNSRVIIFVMLLIILIVGALVGMKFIFNEPKSIPEPEI